LSKYIKDHSYKGYEKRKYDSSKRDKRKSISPRRKRSPRRGTSPQKKVEMIKDKEEEDIAEEVGDSGKKTIRGIHKGRRRQNRRWLEDGREIKRRN
jgi:hypothetical protein